ncbi:MAG: FHA domain-containing protein, partial [Candidatus Aminicenantes bacterium]|nr:FHA domain-containing protein [Candidatus Aminicenantes bacterium]
MPLLHLTCRDGKVFDFPLNKDKIVIGRNEDNDIVLPDPLASRHHVQIKKEKKGYVLKDLGSHNGTKVNGKLIQEVRLKEKDEIQIGQCKLVFLIEEDATVSKSDTFVLASENDQDDWQQQTIRINPQKSCLQDSEELLATIV